MTAFGESSVLILTGAPGVGKTTTARTLASRSDRAVHLESDVFFHFIQSGYVEPWNPESHEQNRIVMRIVGDAAAAYAAAGYFTIVEGGPGPLWGSARPEHRAANRSPCPTDREVLEHLWHDF